MKESNLHRIISSCLNSFVLLDEKASDFIWLVVTASVATSWTLFLMPLRILAAKKRESKKKRKETAVSCKERARDRLILL